MKQKNELIKNEIIIILLLGIILIILSGSFVVPYIQNGNYGMMQWMFPNMIFMMLFGLIFWTLVIIVLVLFIMWLVKQIQEPKRRRK